MSVFTMATVMQSSFLDSPSYAQCTSLSGINVQKYNSWAAGYAHTHLHWILPNCSKCMMHPLLSAAPNAHSPWCCSLREVQWLSTGSPMKGPVGFTWAQVQRNKSAKTCTLVLSPPLTGGATLGKVVPPSLLPPEVWGGHLLESLFR